MREPTAASHFTRNMFQSLAEEFLFDYLPDIIFSFVSHPPDIRYIQIYIFDTNKLSKVSNQYVLPNIIVRCDLQMCKVPNCRRLLPTLRCRYSWNQGNEKYFCLMISTYYLQWHFVIWISSKVDFSSLSGRAVLVVNVASQCGYTDSHYRGLKRLHEVLGYSNKLAVLGQWSVLNWGNITTFLPSLPV